MECKPFVRSASCSERLLDSSLVNDFVRKLLHPVFEEHGVQAISEDSVPESRSGTVDKIYVLKRIVPVLLPALIELLQLYEHREKEGKSGAGFDPLDFLATHLLRNNPNYSEEGEGDRMHEVIADVSAEMLSLQKAKDRLERYRNCKGSKEMLRLWQKFCPRKGDELQLVHIKLALDEFSTLLGLPGNDLEDAYHIFSVMDLDGSGSISFTEFSTIVGKHLYEAERFASSIATNGSRNRLHTWVKQAAGKKILARLEKEGIDSSTLFAAHAGATGLVNAQGCIEAVNDVSSQFVRPSSEFFKEVVAEFLGEDAQEKDFETFSRFIAKVIDEVALRSEKAALEKTQHLAEARAQENSTQSRKLMMEIRRVESRLARSESTVQEVQARIKAARVNKPRFDSTSFPMQLLIFSSCVERIEELCEETDERVQMLLEESQDLFAKYESIRQSLNQAKVTAGSAIKESIGITEQAVNESKVEAADLDSIQDAFLEEVREVTIASEKVRKLSVAFKRTISRRSLSDEIEKALSSEHENDSIQTLKLDVEANLVKLEGLNALPLNELLFKLEIILQEVEHQVHIMLQKMEVEDRIESARKRLEDADAVPVPKLEVHEPEAPEKVEQLSSARSRKSTPRSARSSRSSRSSKSRKKEVNVNSAAKAGDAEMLCQLIEEGADPNKKDKNGSTPIMHLGTCKYTSLSKEKECLNDPSTLFSLAWQCRTHSGASFTWSRSRYAELTSQHCSTLRV